MKLRKLYFDPTVCRNIPISDKIFTLDNLTLSQRFFILEILRFQVLGGDLPYLSQSGFCTKNKIGRDRLRSEINNLIERKILIKFKQKDITTPCEFLLTHEFIQELGYTLEERKKADTEEPESSKAEPETVDYSEEQKRTDLF